MIWIVITENCQEYMRRKYHGTRIECDIFSILLVVYVYRAFSTRLVRVFSRPSRCGQHYCWLLQFCCNLATAAITVVDTKGLPSVISATFAQFLYGKGELSTRIRWLNHRRCCSLFNTRIPRAFEPFSASPNDSQCGVERSDCNRVVNVLRPRILYVYCGTAASVLASALCISDARLLIVRVFCEYRAFFESFSLSLSSFLLSFVGIFSWDASSLPFSSSANA